MLISPLESLSPLGSSGRSSWTPQSPLAGETPNFWVKSGTRNGLVLPDTINPGTGDVTILTPTFRQLTTPWLGLYSDGGALERLFDGNSYTIYFKVKLVDTLVETSIFRMGNGGYSAVQKGMSILIQPGYQNTAFCDGVVKSDTTQITDTAVLATVGWVEVFIEIDKAANRIRCGFKKLSDGSTVGTDANINISTWTFNNVDNFDRLTFENGVFAYADIKKFLGLKTLAQCRNNNYVTGLQFYYPTLFDGSDVSGNAHHIKISGTDDAMCTVANKYYSNASTYVLDNGYDVYHVGTPTGIGVMDLQVPYSTTGVSLNRATNTFGYYGGDGYQVMLSKAGSLTRHNLSDSLLEFKGVQWDRSDVTIFNDACRASIYYDPTSSTTKKRWHISELNKVILNSYTNIDYQGLHFLKIANNSYDDRQFLNELFSYSTNKTGSDLTKILGYTGDNDIPNIVYLVNPYSDVLKITANSDSEFKFNVNNAIVYSQQEIFDKIDALIKLNPNEDNITTIFRWIIENVQITNNLTATDLVEANLINRFNSYSKSECSGLAITAYNIFKHYYPTQVHVCSTPGHVTNYIDNNVYFDPGYAIMLYKGYYSEGTLIDVKADSKLITERIKIPVGTHLDGYFADINDYYDLVAGMAEDVGYQVTSPIDNLTMKLPQNGTFVFPVKSINIPIDHDANMSNWANGIVTLITGITGIVSMPFTLLQVTGTGTVKIDGITYTLPSDEAALKTVLQGYAKYYNSFEVLTNTGGIVSEYLVNEHKILLWNFNKVSLGIITGSVKCESISTAIPVPSFYLTINKGDGDSWTLNHDQQKKMAGVYKLPVGSGGDIKRCTFLKTGIKLPLPISFDKDIYDSAIVNGTKIYVNAGVSVIDQCFAARLDPRNDTFSGSLQLTFTIYDGSDCYYTLDGSTPDASKTLFTTPFTISATTTVKWMNIKTDYANSHINTRVITKV